MIYRKTMNNNPLQVTSVSNNATATRHTPSNRNSHRQEIQARMERLWLQDPEQFNPQRNNIGRKRLQLTIELLQKDAPLKGKRVADLGCGSGVLTRMMRDNGAVVHAVDVAGNALSRLKEHDMHDITAIQDCLPTTSLKDDYYDIVVCTEVIGYLNPDQYRLFFAELSRIVKADGHVLCSSDLDLDSEDSLERFGGLAETEFTIEHWEFSYHRLLIKWIRFFEIPEKYISASRHPDEHQKEFSRKSTFLGRWWFRLNTNKIVVPFWMFLNIVAKPIANGLLQNDNIMIFLESICKFLWSESGISQAIFIGKRRPLTFPLPPSEIPIEPKHKRQTWE